MATEKEEVWLNEYLICWNATEAARRAGYKWPDKQGQEKKAKFAKEIKTRIQELQMTADEVLLRLADEARNDISDFLIPGTLEIDIGKVHQMGHLIKSITHTKYGPKLELYDAQSAKVHIGKHWALFTERQQHEGEITLKVKYEDERTNDNSEKSSS